MSFCTSIRKSCQPKRKIGRGLNKAFHLKEHKILIGRKKRYSTLVRIGHIHNKNNNKIRMFHQSDKHLITKHFLKYYLIPIVGEEVGK